MTSSTTEDGPWQVWRRDREARDPDEWVAVDSGSRQHCEQSADAKNKIAQRLDPTVEFAAAGPVGRPR